ncbi:CPBP family intramembrane metalloprotease [Prescottella equi]|uniref:CPBP family intramembrane glutamic endopeptidase n=1 Tax=Rhodococcus hoagii TaxID=43767 RepID=UPI00257544D6|nr:CPBP family intramembrane glutamic endopeptidase [Prescottella equi]WJJ10898.1 CPBP family intramembrane metalloprotease [Prescottella equi]
MRRAAALGFGTALVAWNNGVLPALRLSSRHRAIAGTVVAAGATAAGSACGLRRDELGLGNIRAGLRWGSAAAALPVVGYAVALAVPSLHDRFAVPDDVRDDFAEWVSAHIPFGTVATEELLFRGLLTAVTERAFPPAGATSIRAVTFGLWHVHPAHVADDSVPGTVAFTAAASLVFDWLRARSGSLLAPALLHLAVNAGGALLLRRIQVTTGAREVPLPPV